MKHFNTTGLCIPSEHYMVDMSMRIDEITRMVSQGNYFTINRARQYGKTTTLALLEEHLKDDYYVLSISFEGVGDDYFSSEQQFTTGFIGSVAYAMEYTSNINKLQAAWKDSADSIKSLDLLSRHISTFCKSCDRPVVLMIDEVDQSSDNQLFVSFLGMLRNKYLQRTKVPTFHSVILAGVYDIKNLKLKLRPDDERKYNSPWNVAVDFNVKMSFSADDIAGMLHEYEQEHDTGMDISVISQLIYEYTAGYPYLVSAICKIIDDRKCSEETNTSSMWTKSDISEAVKQLLKTSNPLFEDMIKHIEESEILKQMLKNLLFKGEDYPYNIYHSAINIGTMFGFITERQGMTVIANRIFETHLYNYFLSEDVMESNGQSIMPVDRNQFIQNGYLNMELVLKKFVEHFTDVYQGCDDKFLEENGRRFFLLYLKPIINGIGNYYIEAQTRDQRRTDIIVDYRGKQYVVEMKIWRGEEYNHRGEVQLTEYLESYHLDKGYMLSFCFNKNKSIGVHEVLCGNKVIVEAVV